MEALKAKREETALHEIDATQVPPMGSRVLSGMFLVILVLGGVPTVASDMLRGDDGSHTLPSLISDVIFTPLVRLHGGAGLSSANVSAQRAMHRFEEAVTDKSLIGAALRPRLQAALSLAGAGTEQVAQGGDEWLYYRPSLRHVYGRAFLAPAELARRRRGGRAWENAPQPDPRPAIIAFDEELRSLGIELLVVPIPTKASIDPWGLAPNAEPPHMNPSRRGFVLGLKRYGIQVLDPTEGMLTLDAPRYLKADSHWLPKTQNFVARAIAERLFAMGVPRHGSSFRRSAETHAGTGDLAHLLEAGTAETHRTDVSKWVVATGAGESLDITTDAQVVLLGDSFSNIYADRSLGWGADGGLAHLIAFHLQNRVQAILHNAGAATTVRQDLARRLTLNDHRPLVVVWEMASRDLSNGDWEAAPLPPRSSEPSRTHPFVTMSTGERLEFSATVAELAPIPSTRSAPYANHVVAVHLVDIAGTNANQALAFAVSMRDRKHTPVSRWAPGDRVAVTASPWSDAPSATRSMSRSELAGTTWRGVPIIYVEPAQ